MSQLYVHLIRHSIPDQKSALREASWNISQYCLEHHNLLFKPGLFLLGEISYLQRVLLVVKGKPYSRFCFACKLLIPKVKSNLDAESCAWNTWAGFLLLGRLELYLTTVLLAIMYLDCSNFLFHLRIISWSSAFGWAHTQPNAGTPYAC